MTFADLDLKYSKDIQNTSKNANPVHMDLVCHVLTSPIDKQGLHTCYTRSAS